MNKWLSSLPEHRAPKVILLFDFSLLLTAVTVRWDPKREVDVSFNQSAILHANYYALQIGVHRVFLTSPQKAGHQTFPSLAICTNAARALSHVVDIQQKRMGKPLPLQMVRVVCHKDLVLRLIRFLQRNAFTAGLILLIAIFGSRRSGLYLDPTTELADVHKCMRILKRLEPR